MSQNMYEFYRPRYNPYGRPDENKSGANPPGTNAPASGSPAIGASGGTGTSAPKVDAGIKSGSAQPGNPGSSSAANEPTGSIGQPDRRWGGANDASGSNPRQGTGGEMKVDSPAAGAMNTSTLYPGTNTAAASTTARVSPNPASASLAPPATSALTQGGDSKSDRPVSAGTTLISAGVPGTYTSQGPVRGQTSPQPPGASQNQGQNQPSMRKSPTIGEKTDAASIGLAGLSSGEVGVGHMAAAGASHPNTGPGGPNNSSAGSSGNTAYAGLAAQGQASGGMGGVPQGNLGSSATGSASGPGAGAISAPAAAAAVSAAPAGTPAAGAAYRPLNVRDALSYLDQVKVSCIEARRSLPLIAS